MINKINIGKADFEKINTGTDSVKALVEFLKSHACQQLEDYADVLRFDGYADANIAPVLIVNSSSVIAEKVKITADLQYNLLQQQNGCADGLESMMKSARMVYFYQMKDPAVSFELDDSSGDDFYPEEYGG